MSNSRSTGVVERAGSWKNFPRRGEDLRQEHRAPETVFSVFAFSQVQLSADCLPHEHLAWAAQTQFWPERPQQVDGTVMVSLEGLMEEMISEIFGLVV